MYIFQTCGYSGDDYSGTIFGFHFQMEKYLKFLFSLLTINLMEKIKYIIVEPFLKKVFINPKVMNPSFKIDEYLQHFDKVDLEEISFQILKKLKELDKKQLKKFLEHYIDNKGYRKRIGYESKSNQEYFDYVLDIAERHLVIKQVRINYEIIDN